MADVDIQGRGDFKEPVQPTPSYGVRLEEAQHPNQTGSALEKRVHLQHLTKVGELLQM